MIVWTLQEPRRQWYSRQLRIASTWTRSGATACPNCLPGFFNYFDIIERASCQTGFSDEAVGLTMCRQCAVGATFTSARNCTPNEVFSSGTTTFQDSFERMTKDPTATAPFTMKIKVVVRRLETSSLLAPNASIAQKWCRHRCSQLYG